MISGVSDGTACSVTAAGPVPSAWGSGVQADYPFSCATCPPSGCPGVTQALAVAKLAAPGQTKLTQIELAGVVSGWNGSSASRASLEAVHAVSAPASPSSVSLNPARSPAALV
ncbi:MAG: hypothetical protein J07HX5_00266 [halophilic archaeon J07HX5]|nr:MAG: hypothetical protein J07HX5_00266 [halophilic archaeon J07HX5]